MKNKLDAMVMAVGLLAMGVLAAAWLVNAIHPHPAEVAIVPEIKRRPAVTPTLAVVPAAVLPNAKSPTYADAKNSFRIFEATYGGKQNGKEWIARVDDRAFDLLRHRGWLKVNPKDLGADPRPDHPKVLYLDYEVLGKEAQMVRREAQGLTLHQLIMHAAVLPTSAAGAGPSTAPADAAPADVAAEDGDDGTSDANAPTASSQDH